MKVAQLEVRINDTPVPKIADGKMLIEVHAAGVNPSDYKINLGYMKDFIPLDLSLTLGSDLAGVVTQVGAGVTEFKPGDEVYGQGSAASSGTGSFAKFDLVSSNSIAHKPKKLTFVEAGGAPLTGVSAIQAIIEHIDLKHGQKILIHGGAGGIGSIAIQIAKNLGAYVITTVKTDDFAFVKKLGADKMVDYVNRRFEEKIRNIDAVLDTVGGEPNKRSYQILKKGGILVSMIEQPDIGMMQQYDVRSILQETKVTTERLNKLTELLQQGIITMHIEKIFPLDQAGEALAYLHDTPPRGKVVIEVKK